MYKLMERFRKARNKKGFTLIELIVVIVIIGILAAIVIPRLSGFSDTAKEGADIATATTIGHAVAAAYADDAGDGTIDTTAYDAVSELITLELLPTGTSSDSQTDGAWVITINGDGDVTVAGTTAGTVFYSNN